MSTYHQQLSHQYDATALYATRDRSLWTTKISEDAHHYIIITIPSTVQELLSRARTDNLDEDSLQLQLHAAVSEIANYHSHRDIIIALLFKLESLRQGSEEWKDVHQAIASHHHRIEKHLRIEPRPAQPKNAAKTD